MLRTPAMRFGRLNSRSAENEPFAAFRRTQTTTPTLTATLMPHPRHPAAPLYTPSWQWFSRRAPSCPVPPSSSWAACALKWISFVCVESTRAGVELESIWMNARPCTARGRAPAPATDSFDIALVLCLVHFVYFAPWRRRRWRWRLLSVCIFQVLNFHCTCLCCCRTCFALVCFLYVSFLFPTRSLFACFFLCFWHYAKCAKPTKYQKIARCTCLPGRHFGLRRLFTTRERVSVEVRLL